MSGHADGDSSLKTVITAVAVNFIIMVAKYVGWALTMSPAMLAEAIHTTADVGNQVLLWIGISQSSRAATPEHPYGWGAARWMWNLMSAMGIFFLGCGVTAYHALHAFLHPDEPSHSPIGLIILGISFVLEGYSFWVAISGINKDRGDMPFFQYLKQGDDPTGVGVLLEDAAAIIGIIFAIIGVTLSQLLRSAYPDAVATALIAALLGLVAIFLARANGRLLVGASAGPKTEAKLRAALERDEVVERVVDLKTEVVGAGKMRVAAQVDLREKIIALRMQADLEAQARRLAEGTPAPQVLHDVAARAVVVAGHEVQRLNKVIDDATPEAAYVDLEIVG